MAGAERLHNGDRLIVEGSAKVTSGQTSRLLKFRLMEATPDVFALFVRRPVFAWVIAILIMLAGILLFAHYPSRNILTLHRRPLKFSHLYWCFCRNAGEQRDSGYEQQLTGLDNLLYFSSTSSSEVRSVLM